MLAFLKCQKKPRRKAGFPVTESETRMLSQAACHLHSWATSIRYLTLMVAANAFAGMLILWFQLGDQRSALTGAADK